MARVIKNNPPVDYSEIYLTQKIDFCFKFLQYYNAGNEVRTKSYACNLTEKVPKGRRIDKVAYYV